LTFVTAQTALVDECIERLNRVDDIAEVWVFEDRESSGHAVTDALARWAGATSARG
jgi:hypothetical protein